MTTSEPGLAARLRTAPFEPLGRFADASNATLLVRLTDRDPRSLDDLAAALGRDPELGDLPAADLAVYKPQRGERPLWDYPHGTLYRREVAAYEVSEALGWGLVPATVARDDGPFGPGSLQRFVPHDLDHHYFHLMATEQPAVLAQLQRLAVFDLVIENGDRKGGHVLSELPAGEVPRVLGVDHGLSFHPEPKLRTVLWDFAGLAVPEAERSAVAALGRALEGALGERLAPLLTDEELAVLARRTQRVAELARFPAPRGPGSYPWPPL